MQCESHKAPYQFAQDMGAISNSRSQLPTKSPSNHNHKRQSVQTRQCGRPLLLVKLCHRHLSALSLKCLCSIMGFYVLPQFHSGVQRWSVSAPHLLVWLCMLLVEIQGEYWSRGISAKPQCMPFVSMSAINKCWQTEHKDTLLRQDLKTKECNQYSKTGKNTAVFHSDFIRKIQMKEQTN